MFKRSKQNEKRVEELQTRLDALVQKVEENHHTLSILEAKNRELTELTSRLDRELTAVRGRQDSLRSAIIEGIDGIDEGGGEDA
jgi:chromosome segregation ATPase